MLDRYLPDPAKRACEVGLDPASVLLGMYSILRQCQANERVVLAQFLAARTPERQQTQETAEQAVAGIPDASAGMVEEAQSLDQIGAAT